MHYTHSKTDRQTLLKVDGRFEAGVSETSRKKNTARMPEPESFTPPLLLKEI